jgi:hypothetical protein
VLIPDYETEVDFLNCEAIAKTVVELLHDNRKRALTVGIHGDWGAGKPSILKMVQSQLSRDKDVAVLWFNGWAFQGFDDAKTVMIEATIAELMRQRSTLAWVKDIGGKLLRRVDWLKVIKRGGGLAFNVMTGLQSPDQIRSALEGLNGVIDKLNRQKRTRPDQKISVTMSEREAQSTQRRLWPCAPIYHSGSRGRTHRVTDCRAAPSGPGGRY